jgi:NAD-dependent SIR2 family protein deacetylase
VTVLSGAGISAESGVPHREISGAIPWGVVPPEVVTAIFYNFALERVAKALPAVRAVAGVPVGEAAD